MKMSLVLNHENLLNFRNVKHTKGCPDTACIEVECVITFDICPFKINSRETVHIIDANLRFLGRLKGGSTFLYATFYDTAMT